jgi:hypothetical protein
MDGSFCNYCALYTPVHNFKEIIDAHLHYKPQLYKQHADNIVKNRYTWSRLDAVIIAGLHKQCYSNIDIIYHSVRKELGLCEIGQITQFEADYCIEEFKKDYDAGNIPHNHIPFDTYIKRYLKEYREMPAKRATKK